MPTTPPAGPDRIASLPWNRSAAVSPPDDIMNMRLGSPSGIGGRRLAAAAACSLPPCGGGLGWQPNLSGDGAAHPSLSPPTRGRGTLPAGGGIGRLRPALHLLRHLRHVAAQDRRQVGIDHGRVAAPDQLDQRRDLVADRDLRKPSSRASAATARSCPEAIGVHEHDRDRLDAVGERRVSAARAGEIERVLNGAVGAHALVDLDHALVQHLRLDDVPGEDLWPRLVADLQRVAETPW